MRLMKAMPSSRSGAPLTKVRQLMPAKRAFARKAHVDRRSLDGVGIDALRKGQPGDISLPLRHLHDGRRVVESAENVGLQRLHLVPRFLDQVLRLGIGLPVSTDTAAISR